ncbi:hypothetical protein NORO109296_11195 [Nocardiopsis rhodophaea]
MPVSTKSTPKAVMNTGRESEATDAMTTPVPATIAMKFHSVTRAPPKRSAMDPPTGRISEPSAGPMKVTMAASRGVRSNWLCSSRPKANPKPMNEPNVAM